MASTYSTNLALELIGTGEQSGTWGTTTNTNLGTLLEQAISGYVTQAITDGSGANTTITIPNGTTGVARNMFIEMTGALSFSTTSLIVPANKKMYFIFNNTSGGFAVTVKVSGQTGILVPNGKKVVLTCNGTDIVEAHTAIVGNATMGGTLGVTGATTLSSTLAAGATTITGTLSATGDGSFGSTGTSGNNTVQVNNSTDGINAAARFLVVGNAGNVALMASSPSYTGITGGADAAIINANSLSGGIQLAIDGVTVSKTTSTGLAVTGTLSATGTVAVGPSVGMAVIRRNSVSGSNGITIQANANDTVSDTNPGASINISGGPLTDTYEGNIELTAYGDTAGVTRNNIIFRNRSGANTVTERARIDSSGNLGIGTTSPVSFGAGYTTIHTRGTSGSGIKFGTSTQGTFIYSDNNDFNMFAEGAIPMRFFTNSALALTLDASGNLLVGTNSVSSGGSAGQIVSSYDGTLKNGFKSNDTNSVAGTDSVFVFQRNSSQVGTIQTTLSAVAYNTSSDYRLKENVQPMTGALASVAALKPVTFNWKLDGSDGQGFIAHELQTVVPDCVAGEKDAVEMQQYEISPAIPATQDEEGNELTAAVEAVMGEREVPKYQGIDTSFLVATLTAAIQEQQAIITALTTRITALEAK